MKGKNILIITIAVLLLFFAGCSKNVVKVEDIETEGDATKVTLGDEETQIEVNVKEGGWCEEGSYVNYYSPEGTIKMKVLGMVRGGKYDGLCHGEMTQEGTTNRMDYYFDENEDEFYYIMYVDGDITEIHFYIDEATNEEITETTINGVKINTMGFE